MKKLIYILLFSFQFVSAQHEMMLLASQQQFANETGSVNYYDLKNSANFSAEVDDIVGFTANGSTTVISIADTDGSSLYSIEGERLAGGGFSALTTTITGLTDAQSYTVTLRIKEDVGNTGDAWLFAWSGIIESINQTITNTTYQDIVIPITMSGTSLTITIYPSSTDTATDKFQLAWITIE